MTGRDLQGAATDDATQERAVKSLQAPVPADVYDSAALSFKRAGFKSTADGIRAACVAFDRHRDVRKAVMLHAPGILFELSAGEAEPGTPDVERAS